MIKYRQAWVKLAIGSNYDRFKYYMHVSKLIKRKQYKSNNIIISFEVYSYCNNTTL